MCTRKLKFLLLTGWLIASFTLSVRAEEIQDSYIAPEYISYCEQAGEEFGIQPEFLEAFIEAESSGNPNASNGKCKGLMQVYESVHRNRMAKMGITNIYDPKSNIRLGASIIRDLFEQYGDDTAKIVMMYNGSSNAKYRAESWNFTDYANKVMNRAYELETIHGKHNYYKYLQKRRADERKRQKMKSY
mgnify:CR=1 FL=1